jgi:tetratricopeptide (TPR) repeat protein
MAPTEAKLYYNLSLVYYRIGDIDNTIDILKKTIDMKANYKDARYAYAVILSEKGNKEEAINQLHYILERIDPQDGNAKKALEEIDNTAK